MSNTQSSVRTPKGWKQPRLIWLIPFSASAVYLSSDYYTPHNWQLAARVCALNVVLTLVICAAVCLHCTHSPQRADRIVSLYFLVSSTLGVLLMVTRLLIPVPSTPDNDPSRINGLLNAWLLCPFIALGLFGILLLAFSPTHRRSLGLYCGLILVITLVLSMETTTRNYLRSIVRALPYTQML